MCRASCRSPLLGRLAAAPSASIHTGLLRRRFWFGNHAAAKEEAPGCWALSLTITAEPPRFEDLLCPARSAPLQPRALHALTTIPPSLAIGEGQLDTSRGHGRGEACCPAQARGGSLERLASRRLGARPGKFELTHDRITERRAARMISEIAALRGTRLCQSAASQSRSDCITRACNRRAMAHGTPRLTATLEPHARRA